MTWPTVAVNTTNVDAGTDSPATARTDIKDAIDKLNQMMAHVTAFAATILDDADAAAVQATLGVPSKTEIQNQTVKAFTTAGTSTAYTLTPAPAIAALAEHQEFDVEFHTAPGTNPTLAVSGLTAKNLMYRKASGAKAAIGAIQVPSGWRSKVVYDGTDYIVREIAPSSIAANSASSVIGFTTGAGGLVSQLTSKSTSVTLDRPTGRIVTHNASLAAGASVSFNLQNTVHTIDDVCIPQLVGGAADISLYEVQARAVAANTILITLKNTSGGSLGEYVIISFVIVKGSSS